MDQMDRNENGWPKNHLIMKKAKNKVVPIIMGMTREKKEENRKILMLHNHPKTIVAAIQDLKEMAEDNKVKNIFEDIEVLCTWALQRLPLVVPPKKEDQPESQPSSDVQSETSEQK